MEKQLLDIIIDFCKRWNVANCNPRAEKREIKMIDDQKKYYLKKIVMFLQRIRPKYSWRDKDCEVLTFVFVKYVYM